MDARVRRITEAGVTLMKRTLTTIAAVLALPLLAEEPAKTATAAQPAQPGQPTQISAPAPAPVESALVAAARRTNRLGKKPANVITADKLVKAGTGSGRVTTTDAQAPIKLPAELNAPPRPTPEMEAARQRDAQRKLEEAKAQRLKEEEAIRRQRRDAANAAADESLYHADEGKRGSAEQQDEEGQKPPQF
jgi:hypothetical protein